MVVAASEDWVLEVAVPKDPNVEDAASEDKVKEDTAPTTVEIRV